MTEGAVSTGRPKKGRWSPIDEKILALADENPVRTAWSLKELRERIKEGDRQLLRALQRLRGRGFVVSLVHPKANHRLKPKISVERCYIILGQSSHTDSALGAVESAIRKQRLREVLANSTTVKTVSGHRIRVSVYYPKPDDQRKDDPLKSREGKQMVMAIQEFMIAQGLTMKAPAGVNATLTLDSKGPSSEDAEWKRIGDGVYYRITTYTTFVSRNKANPVELMV